MHEAQFYEPVADGELPGKQAVLCRLCPHHCVIAKGRSGRCKVRENIGGRLYAQAYGQVCSLAMDPVEKKPLYHFFPGRQILSLGSWSCNFTCAFCQNWEISQRQPDTRLLTPHAAARTAEDKGSVGVAYTYNKPFINYEYVLDCCKEVRKLGLKNVLVSNGYYNPEPLAELLPWADAFNIDLKAFNPEFYRTICGGSIEPVLESLETVAKHAHLEVTLLLIPDTNDDPAELAAMALWLKNHCGTDVPLHLSAYHPCYEFSARPTSREDLAAAREIFQKHLRYVYVGNLPSSDWQNTYCAGCGAELVDRKGYRVALSGLDATGMCRSCGVGNNFVQA